MTIAILISREGGETRACLLVSGKLVNIDAEGSSGSTIVGNIYKGIVADVSRSLNAAFVNIGTGKEGFLSANDIHPAIIENHGRRPQMNEVFSRGQEILVQVVRDPIGEKGATLTTNISLPGRYVVLVPAVEKVGISKKLPEEERRRLREVMESVAIPDGFGVIIRTAGAERSGEELVRDLSNQIGLWNQIEKAYGEARAPALVVREQGLATRFLREYLTPDVDQIMVDDVEVHQEVTRFMALVMPEAEKRLRLYEDRLPLFLRYGVENQIEKMFLRDVELPSGGRIVIDRTEALIAIDVNSGRHKEKTPEETALQTNLEAAEEIASQVMLRDLGGLLVIDFIDMYQARNRSKLQQRLKECMREDKAKISIGRISQFGLIEMSRQKLRSGLLSRATEKCAHCEGLGYRRTISANGLHILRRIRALAASGNPEVIRVVAPVAVANFVQNSLRDLINQLEQERGFKIVIEGSSEVLQESLEQLRREPESGGRPGAVGGTAQAREESREQPVPRPQPPGPQPEPTGSEAVPKPVDQPAPQPTGKSRSRKKKAAAEEGESVADRAAAPPQEEGKGKEPVGAGPSGKRGRRGGGKPEEKRARPKETGAVEEEREATKAASGESGPEGGSRSRDLSTGGGNDALPRTEGAPGSGKSRSRRNRKRKSETATAEQGPEMVPPQPEPVAVEPEPATEPAVVAAEEPDGGGGERSSRRRRRRGGRNRNKGGQSNGQENAGPVANGQEGNGQSRGPSVGETQEAAPPRREAYIYTPPEPPAWNHYRTADEGSETLLDRVIKKLLKLER